MFDKFKHATSEAPELNLIPVMNLMVVLIPLLLLGAAFFHISVIPTSVASDGTGQGEPSPKVTLRLSVTPEALALTGHSGDPEVDPATLTQDFPAADGKYDLEGLQAKLEAIKKAHPSSDTVVLAPYDGLPFQPMVQIVDVVREKLIPRPQGGDPERKVLFPLIVFARPAAEAAPDGLEGDSPTPEEDGG